MKSTLVTIALFAGTSFLHAQSTSATVRIKKIENINGVERVTDTTYTTNDPDFVGLEHDDDIRKIIEGDEKNGKVIKKITLNHNTESAKNTGAEIEQALKEAGLDSNTTGTRKTVIIHKDVEKKSGNEKNDPVAIKKVHVVTSETSHQTNRPIAVNDNKIKTGKFNFYPNPSTGKFNLSFSSADKRDMEVTILNTEGREIYRDKVVGFAGNYDKEIDFSKQTKGMYVIKIEQGIENIRLIPGDVGALPIQNLSCF